MNSFQLSADLNIELINITTEHLGLASPYAVEKDLFLTEAIRTLINVQNETFDLVFQGGTALSKAHKCIYRMSEDCDFLLSYRPEIGKSKKDSQRKLLRNFRHNLVDSLKETGFQIHQTDINVRNEGQFFSIRAQYPSFFKAPQSLKPFLALEFFLGDVKDVAITCEITSLIRQVFGENIPHPSFPVSCMSIIETAAEKWVALTRRIATSIEKNHYYDQSLVRHMYDLIMIHQKTSLPIRKLSELISSIIDEDRNHYRKDSILFYKEPLNAIKYTLKQLSEEQIWEDNWKTFIDTMVYGYKPSYKDALRVLMTLSEKIIKEITIN